MSWMNRQDPYALRVAITSVAANAGQEVLIGEFTNDIEITGAYLTGATAIVSASGAGFLLSLMKNSTAGVRNGTLATYSISTAAAETIGATQSAYLTPTTVPTMDKGEVLVYVESTVGTGTARASGTLVVEYIHL
jgi:hypothetical protein